MIKTPSRLTAKLGAFALVAALSGCIEFPHSKINVLIQRLGPIYPASAPIPEGAYFDQATGARYDVALRPHPRLPVYKVKRSALSAKGEDTGYEAILYRVGDPGWLMIVLGGSVSAQWLYFDPKQGEIRVHKLRCGDVSRENMRKLGLSRATGSDCLVEDPLTFTAVARYANRAFQTLARDGKRQPLVLRPQPNAKKKPVRPNAPTAGRGAPRSSQTGALSIRNRLLNGVLSVPGFGRLLYGFEANGRLVRYIPLQGLQSTKPPLKTAAGRYTLSGDRLCLREKTAAQRCMRLEVRRDGKMDLVESGKRTRDVLLLKPVKGLPWPPFRNPLRR